MAVADGYALQPLTMHEPLPERLRSCGGEIRDTNDPK
jgi:hypothetical protein